MNTTTNLSRRNRERNVGIDVGKDALEIHIYELDKHWKVDNSTDRSKALVRQLNRYQLTRVLVEATGGYERELVEACSEKQLPVVIVQPVHVR